MGRVRVMSSPNDKPSTSQMILKISGATFVMAGVVFMIGGAELLPGLPLLVVGIALFVVAAQTKKPAI